jgi:hypothetical protein
MSDTEPRVEDGNKPDANNKWVTTSTSLINSVSSFVSLATREWFDFLIDQPSSPPFKFNATFKDEYPRVVRLVVVVIVFSAAILGGGEYFFKEVASLSIVRMTMMILLTAFVATLIYLPVAYVFRVRVNATGKGRRKALSPRQVLFTVLYTCVPWVPVFTFLSVAMVPAEGTAIFLLILAFWLCCIYIIYNFTKAIILLTKCSWYVVAASILFPIVSLLAYILFR